VIYREKTKAQLLNSEQNWRVCVLPQKATLHLPIQAKSRGILERIQEFPLCISEARRGFYFFWRRSRVWS
jgi:hypothetical protein